ncbi:hypothetical protein BD626DRAFT_370155, partial [Schizophyllum amplum]
LGDTILGFWRRWCDRAEEGRFNVLYPRYTSDRGKIPFVDNPIVATQFWADSGYRRWMPDIRKINILDRRMLVSKKRTTNLFDLTSLWKTVVLSRLEDDSIDDL